ncbi:MAG: hypothetical protein OEZ33_03370 [Gammaproteobacteria bacterium]|nr:hypothetical protein [Gammaproteobacteria bacterium]
MAIIIEREEHALDVLRMAFLILAVVLLSVMVSPLFANSVSTTPLQIIIQPQVPSDKNQQSFEVEARSFLAGENLIITVQPPKGAKLLSGDLMWQGKIARGGHHRLKFVLDTRAVKTGQLVAHVRLVQSNNRSFGAQAFHPLSVSNSTATKNKAQQSLQNTLGKLKASE